MHDMLSQECIGTGPRKNKFIVYYKVLLETSFIGAYNRLEEHFFSVIFHLIYEIDPP